MQRAPGVCLLHASTAVEQERCVCSCTSAAQAQGTAEGRLTFRQEVEAGHCGVALHASRGRAAAERESSRRGGQDREHAESVMKEGSPELLISPLSANEGTIFFRLNSLLTVESSWGSGHEGPQAHAPKLCCSPEWASTRALRWTVAARRRACIQNSVGRARKPHPAGTGRPVGRGWSRLGAAPGIPRRR